jgi:ribonuclease III
MADTPDRVPVASDGAEAEEAIGGYAFRDQGLLRTALTHKSFAHEHRYPKRDHNERLEFLGDSILGYIVGRVLFESFPQLPEGALSKIKAHFVSAPVLAAKARDLDVPRRIRLGTGELKTGGREKESILADCYEALIAAITIDGGMEAADRLVREMFGRDVSGVDLADLSFRDFKTVIQEYAQSLGLPLPEYRVVDEYGPDHQKTFVVELTWNGTVFAYGKGPSKKEAQRLAARRALQRLNEEKGAVSPLPPATAPIR